MVRLCLDIVSSMEGRFPPWLQGGKGIPQGVIIYATEAAAHVRREGAPMVDKKQISKLYSAAKLSETEQSVLEYLLNNIDTLDDIGIKPVAMACFTSMTTVIRLSKKLGYRGYREMMYDLKHLQHVSREMNQSLKDSSVHFVCHTGDVDVFIAALIDRSKRSGLLTHRCTVHGDQARWTWLFGRHTGLPRNRSVCRIQPKYAQLHDAHIQIGSDRSHPGNRKGMPRRGHYDPRVYRQRRQRARQDGRRDLYDT